jgi:hypothetical protein
VWQAQLPLRQKDSPGHGPSYSLTHRVAGKTVTQVIPQGPAVERAKAQIAEYRRFRHLVRELIVVSEQICSAQVRDSEAAPASEAQKKTSSPIYWPTPSFRRLRRSIVTHGIPKFRNCLSVFISPPFLR